MEQLSKLEEKIVNDYINLIVQEINNRLRILTE